jgi:tRNA nucleotidyltransferase/poly(A) polymerase
MCCVPNELAPRLPRARPLLWPDFVLDWQDAFAAIDPAVPLYLVGGAVRDALLGRPIHDLDFVTSGDSVALARRMANRFGGDIFVLDAERGVARVIVGTPEGQAYLDVTRFRGPDLLADLQARDFTINALAVDFRGDLAQLIDPLNGEEDLLAKQIVMCAPGALADDPLRALRAVRLSVQLAMRITPATLQAIRQHAPGLTAISRERLRDEFFRVLALERVTAALRVMMAVDMLGYIHPPLAGLRDRPQPAPHRLDAWQHTLYAMEKMGVLLTAISPRRTDNTAATFDVGMVTIQFDRYRAALQQHFGRSWADERPHRSLMMLAALLHLADPGAGGARAAAAALRLSNAEEKRLQMMLAGYDGLVRSKGYDVLEVHRFWHSHEESGIDAVLLGLAHILGIYGAELPQDLWLERVELAVRWLSAWFDARDTLVNPPPLLNGSDLMQQLGMAQGPLLGKLITALREAQALGEIHTVAEALAFAQAWLRRDTPS